MESISIESVEASFDQWRAQRSSRSELIPKHLWSMALGLYPQYERSKICRRLRLSGGQFKQHLEYPFDIAGQIAIFNNFRQA